MLQLKVILVGMTTSESIYLEELLRRLGCLGILLGVDVEQSLNKIPDWCHWDLVFARFQDVNEQNLLTLLAPILRSGSPPVFFLVDEFSPDLVLRLLNIGARRVLPVDRIESMLLPNIEGVYEHGVTPQVPSRVSIVDGVASGLVPASWHKDGISSLEYIFSKSSLGFAIINLDDSVCLDCNEGISRILGWERKELIGRELIELGLPGEIGKQINVDQFETIPDKIVITHDQRQRHVRIYLDPISYDDLDCLLVLVEDISDQVDTEDKIHRMKDELERLVQIRTSALRDANRELEEEIVRRESIEDFTNQLSQTLRETTDVVAIGGPDGRLQFLNHAGRSLFGMQENDQVSQENIFSMFSGWDDLSIERVKLLITQLGLWKGENQLRLPGGRVAPISQVFMCKKDDDGNVLYYATIARDISDIKRVEQELRHSRERYRILAEAAHDFIFMVSKDGVMEYANEYSCRALGHDPVDVGGMPAQVFFPKEFSLNISQLLSEVREINRPIYNEGPFYHDDAVSWFGTWLTPIYDDIGQLISVLGISRDITEQKRTDEALQNSLENERKLAIMRSNFFSMTSHQFRTPLSTILLSAELLQKYSSRWDEAKRFEQLNRILDAARRLNTMLEDILVLSRAESGKYVVSPRDFDLIQYTRALIDEIKNNDQGRHLIDFHHEVDQLPVYIDQDMYGRVVDNLLSNALKYSKSGALVSVDIRLEDNSFLLEVSDLGIGIPEEDLKFLFHPFQRASNAIDYPGTGIGLTIIQKAVELMNGTISVKSRENVGTTFLIRFPARLVSPVDPTST